MRRTILFAGIAILALLLVPATSSWSGRGVGAQTTSSSGGLQAQGRQLYLQSCAACHGPNPNGPSEYSTVPSLKDLGGAAAVDWAVRTGRMPFQSTTGEAIARSKPRFSEQEIHALAPTSAGSSATRSSPRSTPARATWRAACRPTRSRARPAMA